MLYLKKYGIAHRDIKGANVLLDENSRVKLSDFGTAKRVDGDGMVSGMKGTLRWMAPEVAVDEGKYTVACDIWSVGCLLLEMLQGGKAPFSNVESTNQLTMFAFLASLPLGGVADHGLSEQLSRNGRAGEALSSFLDACLQVDPSMRPDAATLCMHPLFTLAPADLAAYQSEPMRRFPSTLSTATGEENASPTWRAHIPLDVNVGQGVWATSSIPRSSISAVDKSFLSVATGAGRGTRASVASALSAQHEDDLLRQYHVVLNFNVPSESPTVDEEFDGQ
eukprot:PhM_4_TR13731/c6_g2_i1/m.25169